MEAVTREETKSKVGEKAIMMVINNCEREKRLGSMYMYMYIRHEINVTFVSDWNPH